MVCLSSIKGLQVIATENGNFGENVISTRNRNQETWRAFVCVWVWLSIKFYIIEAINFYSVDILNIILFHWISSHCTMNCNVAAIFIGGISIYENVHFIGAHANKFSLWFDSSEPIAHFSQANENALWLRLIIQITHCWIQCILNVRACIYYFGFLIDLNANSRICFCSKPKKASP